MLKTFLKNVSALFMLLRFVRRSWNGNLGDKGLRRFFFKKTPQFCNPLIFQPVFTHESLFIQELYHKVEKNAPFRRKFVIFE